MADCIYCKQPIGIFQDAIRLKKNLYHHPCYEKELFLDKFRGSKKIDPSKAEYI